LLQLTHFGLAEVHATRSSIILKKLLMFKVYGLLLPYYVCSLFTAF